MVAVVEIIVIFGGGAVHDFVAQGLGLDVAAFPDARGHLVDFEGVGAGAVDHDGRIDLGAVGQGDALDLALGGADLDDLGVEHETWHLGFGGAHDVVGRQGRVVHVTALGTEQGAFEHLGGFIPEKPDPRGV
jgi:hypothetical protein